MKARIQTEKRGMHCPVDYQEKDKNLIDKSSNNMKRHLKEQEKKMWVINTRRDA